MVNNTYAHGYALSLYAVCLENNVVDEILYNYKTLSRIADKEVINFLNIPIVDRNIKKDLLDNLKGEGINEYVINLLKVLVDNDDFDLFQEILKEFEVIYQEENDIKIVNVTVAKELDSDAMDNLVKGLEKQLNSFVVTRVNVDPSVIGGVKLEYDGMEIDNTVIKQLDALKKVLNR